EPDRADRVGLVGDGRLDERPATTNGPLRDAQDLHLDRDLFLLAEQARDRPGADVAERGAEEQVADGLQAQLGELPANRRPHPGENFDGPLEALRARNEARTLPGIAALERRERSHGSDASRSVG